MPSPGTCNSALFMKVPGIPPRVVLLKWLDMSESLIMYLDPGNLSE